MKRCVPLGLLLVALTFATFGDAAPLARDHETVVVGAYLAERRLLPDQYSVKQIETSGAATRLTHLYYCFGDVGPDGPVIMQPEIAYGRRYTSADSVDGIADPAIGLHGAFNQLLKLKARHPNLTILASIGGAPNRTHTAAFSTAARTQASREAFAKAAIRLYIEGSLPNGVSMTGLFDGLDIDWEFPTDCTGGCVPEDKHNFTLLLRELRRQLDDEGNKAGRHYVLTMDGSGLYDDFEKYEWPSIAAAVDLVNLMAYDLVGEPPHTRPHSPLYASRIEPNPSTRMLNADYGVQKYLRAGVPPQKLVLGVPFYGIGWVGVPAIHHGLYQKAVDIAVGSWNPGRESYRKLITLQGFSPYRDPETQALSIFNARTGTFWSYDDPVSLDVKARYVKHKGLRGITAWELSGDDDQSSLLQAIDRGLRSPAASKRSKVTVN